MAWGIVCAFAMLWVEGQSVILSGSESGRGLVRTLCLLLEELLAGSAAATFELLAR